MPPARMRWLVAATLGCLSAACGLRAPEGDWLRVANGGDVETLDPHAATRLADARVLSALYAGLTRLDPSTLEPLPALAEHFESLDGGRRWRFRLRPGLRWSDGTPLTAEDVVASWRRLADPATGAPYRAWMQDARIEVRRPRDATLVEAVFPLPVPDFAARCAFHALAPVPRALREAAPGTLPQELPASGPFRLVARRVRDRVRVARNPEYWNAAQVRLDGIDFLVVESQFTALNLFLAGELHLAPNVPSLAVPRLLAEHPHAFRPEPQFATYFVRCNVRDGPTADRALRRALAAAVDRAALAEAVGGGRRPARTFVPPLLPDYRSPVEQRHDLAAAHAAWSELDPATREAAAALEYRYPTSELNRDVAEVLQRQWRDALGIEVRLAHQEGRSFYPAQRNLAYQLSRSSWVGDTFDALAFLEIFQSGHPGNRTGFADPRYDALIARARAEPERARRHALLAEAEALLLEEAVVLPLFVEVSQELVHPAVRGFVRNPLGAVDWSRLWLEAGA